MALNLNLMFDLDLAFFNFHQISSDKTQAKFVYRHDLIQDGRPAAIFVCQPSYLVVKSTIFYKSISYLAYGYIVRI